MACKESMPVVVDVSAHSVMKDGAASDMSGNMQSQAIRKQRNSSERILAGRGGQPQAACASALQVKSLSRPRSKRTWLVCAVPRRPVWCDAPLRGAAAARRRGPHDTG